jgi:hypothetical protein
MRGRVAVALGPRPDTNHRIGVQPAFFIGKTAGKLNEKN